MKILGKLFGSEARVKILRLFLFNPNGVFENAEIASRARVYSSTARREVALMSRIGLVKRKTLFREVKKKSTGGYVAKRERRVGWALNEKFPYLHQLQSFLMSLVPLRENDILRRLGKAGKLKLVVIAGILTQDADSRVDLLIVGDELKRPLLEVAIKRIESELGTELRYAAFSTSEFEYRLNVYDKLIRDVLDYPHQKVIDRMNISSAMQQRPLAVEDTQTALLPPR